MRSIRWMLLVAVAGAVVAVPGGASANGGAYLEFDRTHYVPGQAGVGIASVFVPREKQRLLERGPFYAFLLPRGTSIREGRPIPSGAIRLGTLSIRPAGRESFDLRVAFTAPDLSGDFYSVMTCNDPCTVSGFREPLSGSISIVQTAREGRLLTKQWSLQREVDGLRHDLRKAERAGGEVQAELDASEQQVSRLATEVNQLRLDLGEARAALRVERSRPSVAPWVVGGIAVALLVVAGAVAIRRRRRRSVRVPDTIEELEENVRGPVTR